MGKDEADWEMVGSDGLWKELRTWGKSTWTHWQAQGLGRAKAPLLDANCWE